MFRKKNAEAIVQISIFIGIELLLLYGMVSKKVNFYVHPRFHAGIWLSIITLLVFSISLIPNIKRARHNININHYIIFAIPILTALIFSASKANNVNISNSNISSMKNTDIYKVENQTDELGDKNTDVVDNENLTEKFDSSASLDGTKGLSDPNRTLDNSDEYETEKDVSEKYAQYEVDGITVIGDGMLQTWYEDLYNNLDCFVDKKYQYLAQVYSMDDFKENQFLAGRYFMVCCAADLAVNGIICESDIRSQLKEGQWITVTGTIEQYEYNKTLMPILKDVTISEAEAPEVEYIYFNYD